MGITTASFNAVAARGRRFRQAYATVPETLPSHASLMTGLYPAGHGIHENARRLPDATPVLAERLKGAGYRTAAVVASFVLAKQFGLARGFDVYDDRPARRAGRIARRREVTEAAMTALEGGADAPLFMWVHYWDPHHPYTPPEPFRSRIRRARISAKWRTWTRNSAGWSTRSSAARRVRRPSSSSATTARDSATTANRSTGTCSTSRRCTCRSWWPARG